MRFLFFQIKEVCYDSYSYFSNSLANALMSLGHQVQFFRVKEHPLDEIESCLSDSYDLILDFNSDLPKLEFEEGGYFLDAFQAPFYDVILDHPLYHHNSLKQKLRDFHVLCLDENHKKYIESYYPHIASVHLLPMTGSAFHANRIPSRKRKIPLLFSGTYTPLSAIEEAIQNIPPLQREDSFSLIEMLKANPLLPIEQAVKELNSPNVLEEFFPLHVTSFFLVDSYMRSYLREQWLRLLLNAGLPIQIYGCDWEKADFYQSHSSHFKEAVSFSETFSLFANSQILLNQMPLFHRGYHDRIFSGMFNGAVICSDSNPLLEPILKDQETAICYSLNQLEALPDRLFSALENPDRLDAMADAAFSLVESAHSWLHRAETFLSFIS